MRATSSAEWLAELTRCMARHGLWPLVLAVGAIVVGVVLYVHCPGVVFYATLAALCALTLYVAHRDGMAGTAVLHWRVAQRRGSSACGLPCAKSWATTRCGTSRPAATWANRSTSPTPIASACACACGPESPPPAVATNVSTPCLPAGRQTLCFLPDRVLVIDGRAAGAVSYDELRVRVCDARFIERDPLLGDARVADHTWRYVNKTSGPDRRFSDNAELPVACYQRLCLSSAPGLNEELLVSRYGAAEAFALALNGTVSRGEAELSIAE